MIRVWVEPRSYDQSHRKNDGFIAISASLSTLLNSSSSHSKLQQKKHGTVSLYLMIELDKKLNFNQLVEARYISDVSRPMPISYRLMLGMFQKNLSPIAIKLVLSFLALRIMLVEKDG